MSQYRDRYRPPSQETGPASRCDCSRTRLSRIAGNIPSAALHLTTFWTNWFLGRPNAAIGTVPTWATPFAACLAGCWATTPCTLNIIIFNQMYFGWFKRTSKCSVNIISRRDVWNISCSSGREPSRKILIPNSLSIQIWTLVSLPEFKINDFTTMKSSQWDEKNWYFIKH